MLTIELTDDIDLLVYDVVKCCVDKTYHACCITVSILLHELIPGSRLVEGYLNVNGKYSCWHVWLEYHDRTIDAGHMINVAVHDLHNKVDVLRSLAPLYERCDMDTTEEKKIFNQNMKLLEIYRTAPEKYWNLIRVVDRNNYNLLVEIYNTFSPERKRKLACTKPKPNDKCGCQSTIKYKRCCAILAENYMNINTSISN